MARLRRNEWNFAARVAALITEILKWPEFEASPLGLAEPELTELRGAKRLDLVIFERQNTKEPAVTGELKGPWDPDGRTPYNTKVRDDAHGKASTVGVRFFVTWNVRRVVVWKTDDPGVPLEQRVLYADDITDLPIRRPEDLDRPDFGEHLKQGTERLVRFLHGLFIGPPEPTFLPLDRVFVSNIEAALDFPIDATIDLILSKLQSNRRFKQELEKWMRDEQHWIVSDAVMQENVERAVKFACYVLVNRLCFYNALRRKYGVLPRLAVANNIATGEQLKTRLTRAFNEAERYTGDYETVFAGDFGDTLPFLCDEAVPEWRSFVRFLDHYDFANIRLDIIGAMYEQLISPDERYRYGQHYTRPEVVDLINAFAIRDQGQS